MPKQKTHRGLAKRVKRTGGGGLKRHSAFTSHRFHGKTKKQRRQLRKASMVSAGDYKRIRQQLSQMR
ncbi:50S ribosomal protein L35 [Enterococcus asini]|jgi:ribosomal protein L35|uniref:Large ribosomal subunit protein bL35 n=2 Tax=Enterococcus asini TaxID=57732 RepID=R2RYS4_9ENTE|nr:50S ribosomal protein L35 [Enterococcus asini]EOH85726.1 50S ribosomal protein L35 [Enterococcus asini ATCC 700915]EOT57677.1 50S ribosomal protein L35 [Enterococcus asini ATCC 700915]MCD5030316.1 50S ribosomal protein L35 [Enterococcus asini]MDT2745316.1 50S ribosomal protein L35 [Enterococcus asini]MDT2757759.1 50S ribosomal protein L35 [Enterococcus asini]